MTRVPVIAAYAPLGFRLPAPLKDRRLHAVEIVEASDVDRLCLLVEANAIEITIGTAVRAYPVGHVVAHYDLESNDRPAAGAAPASAGAGTQPSRRRR